MEQSVDGCAPVEARAVGLPRLEWDGGDDPPGALILANGTVVAGRGFGAGGRAVGEVVFNTSMTGYQEILTDPSYCGQIVTMTYPLVGNYGVLPDVDQSRRPFARGLIVREWCREPSHHLSVERLDSYLRRKGVVALEGVDTRALTRHLRARGTMGGMILTGHEALGARRDPGHWVERAAAVDLRGVVDEATTPEPYALGEAGARPHVVVVDYGVKRNILTSLLARGCRVTVVSARATAREVVARRPDGVLLSNGPGDPADVAGAADTVRRLVESGLPILGICLGHQMLGLAFGAKSFKLPYGHRGANHPVRELDSGRVLITAQNHGYALDADSVDHPDLRVTHVNLNDGTVEGLEHRSLPVFSIQYHPEASPGPEDSQHVFDRFVESMREAGAPGNGGDAGESAARGGRG